MKYALLFLQCSSAILLAAAGGISGGSSGGGGINGGGGGGVNTNSLTPAQITNLVASSVGGVPTNLSVAMQGGGLANFIYKAKTGQEVRIGFLGDSLCVPQAFGQSTVSVPGALVLGFMNRDGATKGYGMGWGPCSDIALAGGANVSFKDGFTVHTNYNIPSGGSVTFGQMRMFGSLNTLEINSAQLGTSSSFNVQLSTNGGAFFTVATVSPVPNNSNVLTTSYSITVPGTFQVKIVGGGSITNKVFGINMYDSSPFGFGSVIPYMLGCSGSSIVNYTNLIPFRNLSNEIVNANLDLLWVANNDSLDGGGGAYLTNAYGYIGLLSNACNGRIFIQGTSFDSSDSDAASIYNTTAERKAQNYIAQKYGLSMFDSGYALISLTNQTLHGWMQDTVHLNGLGITNLYNAIMQNMGVDLTIPPINQINFNLGSACLVSSATYGEGDGAVCPAIKANGGTGGAFDLVVPNWATQCVYQIEYHANSAQTWTNQYFGAYLNASDARTLTENWTSPITAPANVPTWVTITNTWPVTNGLKWTQFNFKDSASGNTRQVNKVKGLVLGTPLYP